MADSSLSFLVREGDVRALARAIRLVEDGDPAALSLIRELRGYRELPGGATETFTVGITGPPGSGKSTICDLLIAAWRVRDHRVGVLAVDPSSPFSGGAILGDRVRMQRHSGDNGVYIRSMATRGHLGGLAVATREALRLVAASGRDRCLVETVGVGQSELEIMETTDTTVVVTTPTAGDSVQIIKAGILEIADVFVVNKADLPGAPKVGKELRELVKMASPNATHAGWTPPIIATTATTGDGIEALLEAIEAHHAHLVTTGDLLERRRRQLRAEVEAIVVARASGRARRAFAQGTMAEGGDLAALAGLDPHALADQILGDQPNGNSEAPAP